VHSAFTINMPPIFHVVRVQGESPRFLNPRTNHGGNVAGTGATTIDVTEVMWKVIKEGAIPEKEIAEVLNGT
jgi:hypothetical protein